MIKELIDHVNTIIADSDIINRYGGYCQLSNKKTDYPVGVGLDGDCKGNTYTYDDRVLTSGFLSLEGTTTEQISSQFGYLVVRLNVHVFTNHKKYEDGKYYMPAVKLTGILMDEMTYGNKIINCQTKQTPDSLKAEYSVISIQVKIPFDCVNPISRNRQNEC